MGDAISVECPACQAKLKLKSRSAVGKRVPCPKCKKPFVVAVPPAEEDSHAFLNVAEPDADEFADLTDEADSDQAEESALPARRTKRGGKKGQRPSAPVNWQKPLLIGAVCLLFLGLLGGLGYVGLNFAKWLGPTNKIDLAWLPPDADIVGRIEMPAVWNAQMLQPLLGNPMLKPSLDKLQKDLGINADEIQSVTFARSGFFEHDIPSIAGGKGFHSDQGPVVIGRQQTQSLVVLRLKSPAVPAGLQQKLAGKSIDLKDYGGVPPTFPVDPIDRRLEFFIPAAGVIVIGPRGDVIDSVRRGAGSTRRADLDFIDATQPIVVAFVPKSPAGFDPPQGTMPGMRGSQASSRLQEIQRGKVKGICLGASIGTDLNWRMSMNCTTPEATQEIAAEMEKSLQETKAKFSQVKAFLPAQLAELVQVADTTLNSITTKSTGAQLDVIGQVPSSIKGALEKLASTGPALLPLLMGMPGAGGPFGDAIPPVAPGQQPPADGPNSLNGQNPFGANPPTLPTTPEPTQPMNRADDWHRNAWRRFAAHP